MAPWKPSRLRRISVIQRLEKPAFWCIDPMDGTLAFTRDQPGFSVSIALVARDGTPLLGVVYDPVQKTLYHGVLGGGAYRNGERLSALPMSREQSLVLRTDPSFQSHPWLEQTRVQLDGIARDLGARGSVIEYMTGAVMNACGILDVPNTCYFKYPRTGNSGGSLWDYAATACLFREAGAIASDIHGGPLDLNRGDSTFANHRGILFAASGALAERIQALYVSLCEAQAPGS